MTSDLFTCVEIGWEYVMVPMDDVAQYLADGAEIIGTYDRLAWHTFGHAPADETIAECLAECAYAVMVPILSAWMGRNVAYEIDAYAAVCEAHGYSGRGWAEGENEDGYSVSESLSDDYTYGIAANLPAPLTTDENSDAAMWELFAAVNI
jgi:hypothetical protein